MSDEERVIPLDIYETSDEVGPEALPEHWKDLMMLRLHEMQASKLLQAGSGAQPMGMVMFVSKDKLEDAVVFGVTLDNAEREMHEYIEVLSEHYLSNVLGRLSQPRLGIREHASGLLSEALKYLKREFDAMDDHMQTQWLHEFMLPLVDEIKS